MTYLHETFILHIMKLNKLFSIFLLIIIITDSFTNIIYMPVENNTKSLFEISSEENSVKKYIDDEIPLNTSLCLYKENIKVSLFHFTKNHYVDLYYNYIFKPPIS